MEEMAAGVGEEAVYVSGVSLTQQVTVCLKGGCECSRMSRLCAKYMCVSMGKTNKKERKKENQK